MTTAPAADSRASVVRSDDDDVGAISWLVSRLLRRQPLVLGPWREGQPWPPGQIVVPDSAVGRVVLLPPPPEDARFIYLTVFVLYELLVFEKVFLFYLFVSCGIC